MALSFSVFNKFKAVDGVTAPVRKMEKSVGKFGKTTTKEFKRADFAASKFGKRLKSVTITLVAAAAAAISLLGVSAVTAAVDFEEAFTGVIKTVKATESELANLETGLTDLSRTIPISTVEIFGIAEAAGQLGIKTKDILKFTKVMADLGATTNLTSEEAATSLARFANITGVVSDDFSRLGSTIVGLGNNFATTEAEIVAMAMRLGAAGKLVGLSAADTLGLSAALTSVGIEAEAGGTAFSQVMIKLNKEIGTGSAKMKLFAKVSGKTVGQFEKLWEKDAPSALLSFIDGLKRTQDIGENVNITLDELGFSGIRVSDALLRAAGSGDLFRRAINSGNREWDDNIALINEANLRYGTLGSKMKIFKNLITIMGASFGKNLTPFVSELITRLIPLAKRMEDVSRVTGDWLQQNKFVVTATLDSLFILFSQVNSVIMFTVKAVGDLLVAWGPALSIILPIIAAMKLWAVVQGIVNILMTANPIGLFIVALAGLTLGMKAVIDNWDILVLSLKDGMAWIKNTFLDGMQNTVDMLKSVGRFAGGLFGGESEVNVNQSTNQTPISPNAGMINTIRQETTSRSKVDVNLNNLPQGSTVKQSGDVAGFNLETGFAGAL